MEKYFLYTTMLSYLQSIDLVNSPNPQDEIYKKIISCIYKYTDSEYEMIKNLIIDYDMKNYVATTAPMVYTTPLSELINNLFMGNCEKYIDLFLELGHPLDIVTTVSMKSPKPDYHYCCNLLILTLVDSFNKIPIWDEHILQRSLELSNEYNVKKAKALKRYILHKYKDQYKEYRNNIIRVAEKIKSRLSNPTLIGEFENIIARFGKIGINDSMTKIPFSLNKV